MIEGFLTFQNAMEVSKCHVVSPSGGYGAFDLRPHRLVELGYAQNPRKAKIGKRDAWRCDFAGPWSARKFLGSPLAQVTAFHASVRSFIIEIERGQLTLPDGCSLAGALAILHVGRRSALKAFPDLFSFTRKRYDTVKGLKFDIAEGTFNLAALAFLARLCKAGNERALEEWKKLSRSAHRPTMSAATDLARKMEGAHP